MDRFRDILWEVSDRAQFAWQIVSATYYIVKLIWKFPLEEWKTFDQILTMGIPEEDAEVALCFLVDADVLEARPNPFADCDAPVSDAVAIARKYNRRLRSTYLHERYFEYRLVHRPPAPDVAAYARGLAQA